MSNTAQTSASAHTRPGTIKLFRANATWPSTNPVSIPLMRPLTDSTIHTVGDTRIKSAGIKDTYMSVLIDAPTPLGRVLVHAHAKPNAGPTRADATGSVDDASFVLRSSEGGYLRGQLNREQLTELYASIVCEGREILGSRPDTSLGAGPDTHKIDTVVLYDITAIGEEDVPATEDGETMTYEVEGQAPQKVRFVKIYTKVPV